MDFKTSIIFFQIIYFFYFIGINLHYLLLNFSALFVIKNHMEKRPAFNDIKRYSGFELPVTIIVPAYNEEETIVETVTALLQLDYIDYEIIVVNDGSKDNTLDILMKTFDLSPFPEVYRKQIDTQTVKTIYRSAIHPNVKVVDKENGGKSDALNAGLNISQCPLFCCIDADSILTTDSMRYVVRQFLEEPDTIACGGTIRIANGCTIENGLVKEPGLSKNLLALIQTIEYLRAFLFGRLGWVPFNSLLIISGSFSVFKKQAVLKVGGYNVETIGEDMELVVRLHLHHRLNKIPYSIVAIPEPIAFTEAPEDLISLRNQRVRWQRGLCESLARNINLLYHPRGGAVGWIGFPTLLFFEMLGPIIEISGYIFFLIGFFFGIIEIQALVAFLILSIGFSLFISIITIILEEISFKVYPKASSIGVLFFAALFENLGFRQLNTFWRVRGILNWIFRTRRSWGSIQRKGVSN
jgi:cellulose synthase/poly-beta-1,6-N-acetylglucosamine synthase-like glycosyltransferase